MDVLGEDGSVQQRRQNVRQQEVRHGVQAVAGSRMAADVDSQIAQLLHQSPHFRAAGPDLGCDLGSADHYGGVVRQQPNDASQPGIGLWGGLVEQPTVLFAAPFGLWLIS